MKILKILSLTFLFSLTCVQAANAYHCTKSEIVNVYIPILKPTVDWPDDMIYPYAKQLCLLTKEKNALQASISSTAEATRTGNFRICKEVIPGNPNPTDAECKTAYDAKVNGLIDQCIALMGMGHNPHNVLLIIDPIHTEVRCLRGVNLSFQQ
jgi:hypothetical protein